MLESYYKASATTISIQEGEDCGQSINHFHAHVIPRVNGDLNKNDYIYNKISLFDEEFIRELTDLQSNLKNQHILKEDAEKFKEFLLKSYIY